MDGQNNGHDLHLSYLGPTWHGHYNEVVKLVMKYTLSMFGIHLAIKEVGLTNGGSSSFTATASALCSARVSWRTVLLAALLQ